MQKWAKKRGKRGKRSPTPGPTADGRALPRRSAAADPAASREATPPNRTAANASLRRAHAGGFLGSAESDAKASKPETNYVNFQIKW